MSDASTFAVRPTAEDIAKLAEEFSAAWDEESADSDKVGRLGDMMELSCEYKARIIAICCIKGFFTSRSRTARQG